MNRIKETFNQLKKNNKKALGIFLTAGDPDFESSLNLIQQLPESGVDFVDSTGLGVLIGGLKRTRSHGGDLRCIGLTEPLKEMFKLTGLDAVLSGNGEEKSEKKEL